MKGPGVSQILGPPVSKIFFYKAAWHHKRNQRGRLPLGSNKPPKIIDTHGCCPSREATKHFGFGSLSCAYMHSVHTKYNFKNHKNTLLFYLK